MGLRSDQDQRAYPVKPNIDDQIVDKSFVIKDVFAFSERFEHIELSEKDPHFVFQSGDEVMLVDEEVQIVRATSGATIVVKDHADVKTRALNLPQQYFKVAAESGSDIRTEVGDGQLHIYPEGQELLFDVQGHGEPVYVNQEIVTQMNGQFTPNMPIYVNGILIERSAQQLKVTSIVGDFLFETALLRDVAYEPTYPIDFPEYRRSPRLHYLEPTERVTISQPDPEVQRARGELVRAIVPPLGMFSMSLLMAVLSNGNPIMSVGMGGMSLFTAGMSISSYMTNKRDDQDKMIARVDGYEHYLLQRSVQLASLAQEQRFAREYAAPNKDQLLQLLDSYDSRIYERTQDNADYLQVSIGTGDVEASYAIDFQVDGEAKNELEQAALDLTLKYRTLRQAPINIALKGQTLGYVGVYAVLKDKVATTLLQLAAFHSYHDVQFIALVPESDYETDWYDWRWLPHFKMNDLNLRGMVHDANSRDLVLNSFYQLLKDRQQILKDAGRDKPRFAVQYVLVIMDESWLSGHGLNEFLIEDMNDLGVTVIWCKENRTMLPETVTTMLAFKSLNSGELVTEDKVVREKTFLPYQAFSRQEVVQAISRLANLQHIEIEKNTVPESVTFLEMYQVNQVAELNVKERWARAETNKSLAVPLGLRSKDDIVYLNLHERAHGPHGLVAGTTGSGKSETLQSYILSLAVNFSPEDVGFLPIDFKGGGMAHLFNDLPHLMGAITNLDGASSARALASIRAELQKRQRVFNEFGVNSINKYTKLYKAGQAADHDESEKYPTEPIPHLFLISDEFAELKANEPEFMAELVSAARIGRSLGVHLILATQKPSGVVDEQIWSNSRFKLALKVQDVADSKEILKTPDAASIVEPGRAYLQVGNNEIYELFQSAWSGGAYRPDDTGTEMVDERIWFINQLGQSELISVDLAEDDVIEETTGQKTQSELDAVVQYIAETTQALQPNIPAKPWLPPLEQAIVSPSINFEQAWQQPRDLRIPLGMLDLPDQQLQETLMVDITEQSHTIYLGSSGFGKTTALHTYILNLARQNSPEHVRFNLFDFGTNGLFPLKKLPHVADIVNLDETDKLVKFVKQIQSDIEKRKEQFLEVGVSSLAQYEAKTGRTLPINVTVIDGYDALHEHAQEILMDNFVNQILREGASVGMYVQMTGLRENTFRFSMLSNIPTMLVYYLVDEGAARSLLGVDALIPQRIPGRAQIKLANPAEFQTYLVNDGTNDLERSNLMTDEVAQMDQAWQGTRPVGVPMVPRHLSLAQFNALPMVQTALINNQIPVGMDIETTQIMSFNPAEEGAFLIVNETTLQRDLMTDVIIQDLQELSAYDIVVFDVQDQLDTLAAPHIQVLNQDEQLADFVQNLPEFIAQRRHVAEAKPLILYWPSWYNFDIRYLLDATMLERLLTDKSLNVSVIVQSMKSELDYPVNETGKLMKRYATTGVVGSKLNDQQYFVAPTVFTETVMPEDQTNYYNGRFTTRIKLPSNL